MEVLIVLLIVGAFVLYFLPSVIAGKRNATSAGAITIINILFGWTVIGWIAALIWACTDAPESAPRSAGDYNRRRPCPFCAEMIMPQAIVCPHCRKDIPTQAPPAPIAAIDDAAFAVTTEQVEAGKLNFVLALAALVAVFVIAAMYLSSTRTSAGQPASAAPAYATGVDVSPCSEFGNDLTKCERELKKRGIAFPTR